MLKLTHIIAAWNSDEFNAVVKQTLRELGTRHLPLQQGMVSSSAVVEGSIEPMILSSQLQEGRLLIRVGIFYSGIVAGCNCADDPSGVPEQSEYCELQLDIQLPDGETEITLLQE